MMRVKRKKTNLTENFFCLRDTAEMYDRKFKDRIWIEFTFQILSPSWNLVTLSLLIFSSSLFTSSDWFLDLNLTFLFNFSHLLQFTPCHLLNFISSLTHLRSLPYLPSALRMFKKLLNEAFPLQKKKIREVEIFIQIDGIGLML